LIIFVLLLLSKCVKPLSDSRTLTCVVLLVPNAILKDEFWITANLAIMEEQALKIEDTRNLQQDERISK